MRPIQRQTDAFSYRIAGSAEEVLTEWGDQRKKDFGRVTPSAPEHKAIPCPKCLGQGYDDVNDRPCRACEATGWSRSQPRDKVTRSVKPYANRLEKALYQEFMEWWPTSETAKKRTPSTSGTGWRYHPKEPITHWLNVEDFLKERHPEAATGSQFGMEEITPKMKRLEMDAPFTPEELDKMGFSSNGNVKTQAMLNLHNKLQGRNFTTTKDRRRYYELMLKHVGPDARRLTAFLRTAYADDRTAAFDQALVDRLRGEFNQWWDPANPPHPDSKRGKPGVPLSDWQNIASFLEARYPATNKTRGGMEDVYPALEDPALATQTWGESSPERTQALGYDPQEIAAGMLALHNRAWGDREDWTKQDMQVMTDIFQKRQKMQRDYDDRMKAAYRNVRLAYAESHSASPLTDDTIYGLSWDFNEWARKNNKTNPYDERLNGKRGPIGYWPNIEEFLQEKYPAAHRGLSTGFEEASQVMDGLKPSYLRKVKQYQTGPKAIAEHGYDPKEIAAAMLILHNGSHPGRENWVKKDQARLLDIVQKRHKMQQAYDSRSKVARLIEAATLKELDNVNGLLGTLEDEYNEWYAENGDDRYNWAGRGPLGNWRQIENFLQAKYPAAYRGYNAGHESAGDVLDNNDDYAASHEDLAYDTGPEAIAKHGYDPAEVTAGMLYLHNQSHPSRASDDEWLMADTNRLVDIARKRMKMQRDYEVKQTPTAPAGSTQRTPDENTSGFDLKYAPEYSQHRIDTGLSKKASAEYGDCYEAAGRHLMDQYLNGKPTDHLRIVHGEVAGQGPMQGKTFGHAWVEDGDTVIDNSNGRTLTLPKAAYYALGKIDKFNNTHVYTWEQARDKMMEHEHFGPWDLKGTDPNYVESPMAEPEPEEDDDDDWMWDDEDEDDDIGVHTGNTHGITIRQQDDDWLAHHNGQEVGSLSVDYTTDPPSVDSVRVHPDYRRKGIGRSLWEAAGRPAHTADDMSEDGRAWARSVGGDYLEKQSRELLDAKKALVMARRILLADQNQADPGGIIGFLVWCIRHHHSLDYEELSRYAQQSNISLEDYEDIGRWLDEADNFPLREAYKLAGQDWWQGTHLETPVRLEQEFTDWWKKTNEEEYAATPEGAQPPLDHWSAIENFLRDKYPAAHRGLTTGMEEAQPLLDQQKGHFGDPIPQDHLPYETGPEAVAKHGYDPAEMVAGMLMLHNHYHGHRPNMKGMDLDRIMDIARKRSRMQKDFQQRKVALLRFANNNLTEMFVRKLKREFDQWHGNDSGTGHGIGDWKRVEDFLQEKYPAAHRGFDMSLEEARPLLRGEPNTLAEEYPTYVMDHPRDYTADAPYETGPDAIKTHGYDPKAVAAGMVLLHNRINGLREKGMEWAGRDDEIAGDVDLLNNIFHKRKKMQDDYMGRAASVLSFASRLLGE